MEKIESFKELKKNAEDKLISNDMEEYNEKVEKFYTCEEKWNILQALQTMSPELVCVKFDVELALLTRWIETSVIIYEALKRRKRNKRRRSLSDSNHETDSSSNYSESSTSESLISQRDKEEILNDFKILSRKQFNRKHGINKYLLHILIVQKLQMKKIYGNKCNENLQINQNQNLHNEFCDCNKTNCLKKEIEEAQKLVEHLYDWYLQMQQKGIFVAEFMLRKEANRIAKTLNYGKFRANNAWLSVWYEIYNINLRTINKFAEYFDRTFLYENTDIAQKSSKKHMLNDSTDRLKEIDNIGEDLYFWYEDNRKDGKLISNEELCVRAEEISVIITDRPFFPDIVWLYEWKKQYNIQCTEMEWKLFKYTKVQFKKHKNVKKHGSYLIEKKLKYEKLCEKQLSSSTSSIELNEPNQWIK